MENFSYRNPVKIIFGRQQISKLAAEVSGKILLVYGGGSIQNNGVYDQVITALGDCDVVEFSGVEANPQYQTLMKAVAIGRREHITMILAVGGGSVVDGCKFIAAAIPFTGDPWTLLEGAKIEQAIPFGAVLTLPATGSEMNRGAVISRAETGEKRAFMNDLVFPKFSILDPETTYSLPMRQIGNGIVDSFVHVLEQYLTYPADNPLQDRFAEGILQTLIEQAPHNLESNDHYSARANLMWCATLALNGLIAVGVPEDWATHMIGHELTALKGLDHAQTLAIIMPALLHHQRDAKKEKLLQYGKRVWQVGSAEEAIARTETFFQSCGVQTKLIDYGLDARIIAPVVAKLEEKGYTALGEHGVIDATAVKEILQKALH